MRIPINLHISNQALSSGLKPLSEKYYQSQLEYRTHVPSIFRLRPSVSEVGSPNPDGQRKLYLSGFTGNLLLNDPSFSMMFLIYTGTLTLLGVVYLLKRSSYTEFTFRNSTLLKAIRLFLSQVIKIMENSHLILVLTGLILMEERSAQTPWDVFGVLFFVYAVLVGLVIFAWECRELNRRFYTLGELRLAASLLDDLLYDTRFLGSVLQNRSSFEWVIKNYHILGIVKKSLMGATFFILKSRENNLALFSILYAILGA